MCGIYRLCKRYGMLAEAVLVYSADRCLLAEKVRYVHVTKEEDGRQWALPRQSHPQTPHHWYWQQDHDKIRDHVHRAGYACCQRNINASAFGFWIPCFVHQVALDHGQDGLGDVVGQIDEGHTPKKESEARDRTEDAMIKEES